MSRVRLMAFSFRRFSLARLKMGGPAAEVSVNNGRCEKLIWMRLSDVEENLRKFPASPGLLAAKAAFHRGLEVDR